MVRLQTGDLTGFQDKNGKSILFGDTVELEGQEFEVVQNDFTDDIVIDGVTGQEELRIVAYMCEVNMFKRLVGQTTFPQVMEVTVSDKYKDADEVLKHIWELRNKFATKYGLHVMPNTVYLGENLVTVLNDNHPYTNSVVDVFAMKIVEVMETDHMSLGLTLQKH
ncbi:hypothetical protein Blue_090 [Bacillus phage Deep Blue]|uniref:Uncharacterized protein n=1 Tax=Bacillus phage Deep Blue TaxID=1792245 RepID=A0A140HLQ1_9CAUD|nr:hypothetical protein Blue_090 [Bacillus phage Deep Blue]AMO25913.1 hypothetical protein Blue_090 [Bacillus phage Deep Blue]